MRSTERLTMLRFLTAVQVHGNSGAGVLHKQGIPFKVIYRKAEKATRKGLTDYGVSPHHCWLTPKGEQYLQTERERAAHADRTA